jgi:hypothetical protein
VAFTHHYLAPRLDYTPLPLWALVACYGVNFTVRFFKKKTCVLVCHKRLRTRHVILCVVLKHNHSCAMAEEASHRGGPGSVAALPMWHLCFQEVALKQVLLREHQFPLVGALSSFIHPSIHHRRSIISANDSVVKWHS